MGKSLASGVAGWGRYLNSPKAFQAVPSDREFQWRLKPATLGGFATLLLSGLLQAEDKKPEPPRITAMEPCSLVAGYTGPFKLRGFQLKTSQQVIFAEAPNLKVELKDKKDSGDTPNVEKKENGDSQLEVQLTIPPEQAPGALTFTVQTEAGTTAPVKLELFAPGQVIEEKEPNGGFLEAQLLEFGKTVRGNISQNQDVDVYQFQGHAGQKIRAEIIAARAMSFLDALLTLRDAKGVLLAQEDDSSDSRDPVISLTLPGEGRYFLTVADALDHGGEWHAYTLQLKEIP